MIVELNRDDLVSLVMGQTPSYKMMEHPLFKLCGEYHGGMNDHWSWNVTFLVQQSEESLWGLYNTLKADKKSVIGG